MDWNLTRLPHESPACFCVGFLLGCFCGFLRIVAGYVYGVGRNHAFISLISFEGCPSDREFAFTLDRQPDSRQSFEVVGTQCAVINHHFVD